MAGFLRGGECDGEGRPAGFGEDLLGQVRERLAGNCRLLFPQEESEVAAPLLDYGDRLDCGRLVRGAEVLGCLSCGFGLLIVVVGLVPVAGSYDGQKKRVEEDREGSPVLWERVHAGSP
ncbi:hypothetical protein [Streptomyces sp. ADI96-02]|uniref:hypothetical protein n=1 Tax=Streptomyces sp. ADI96-02 TaxID=1522760 RepID=UPI000F550BDD|nr:hypothetical protein [Streptomyces sp. ADI96-02]